MDVIDQLNNASDTEVYEIISELSVHQIEKIIKIAAKSYYNSSISLISDEIYDILIEKLKILHPDSDVLSNIGAKTKGKKVKLPYWMGSMDKIKTEENLIENWKNDYNGPYVLSDKLDGVSCLIHINKGKAKMYTRGDGKYGQDVSHLLDHINSCTEILLSSKIDCAIRGELIVTKKDFHKYSKQMKNARNMVSGIVNSKPESIDTDIAFDVNFIAYEIIDPIMKPSKQMEIMKKWGLNVVNNKIYDNIDLQILDKIFKKRKDKSNFEIDGIIVTDDKKHPRNTTGNPSYSFAYKGMTEVADVKVLGIDWRPSKDGKLVPRIRYEKVNLSQADLQRANGIHARFILKNKISVGSTITIIRSGAVIPNVLAVKIPGKPPYLPDNIDFIWDKTKTNIYLKNVDSNSEVIIQRIHRFMKTMEIESISEGIIRRLFDAGYNSIFKILDMKVNDFMKLEGFKETLSKKLVKSIKTKMNKIDILTLMSASNCFGAGFAKKKIAKILDKHPNIVNEYKKKNYEIWIENLIGIDGIQETTARQFLENLPEFSDFYKKIKKRYNVSEYKPIKKSTGIFIGEKIVFTGLRNLEWEKIIMMNGGEITGTVTKKTTILVHKKGETNTSKYNSAKKLGIKIYDDEEFSKIISKIKKIE